MIDGILPADGAPHEVVTTGVATGGFGWSTYLARRRTALLDEVRAIEDVLGLEPKVRAMCPTCRRKWNMKEG